MNTDQNNETQRNPWAHRCAWLLACATFPLIWVGGMVTTTDAGMAFPDWITSDGYFMPLYPWLSSAGDKFVEHGHRLLGMTAGILSILLVTVTWLCESRRWVRFFSFAILAGVILQGVLGGMRVMQDSRILALVHGCTGPLFFGMCVAMVVFTSRWWQNTPTVESTKSNKKVFRLAIICTCLAFAQLVVGAVVRHSPHMLSAIAPALFQIAVYFHVFLALMIVAHGLLLAGRCLSNRLQMVGGLFLLGLIGIQVLLGMSTWVVKYGIPAWATTWFGEMSFVNREADFLQTSIITSHVAIGSLVLVTALAIALRLARQLGVIAPRISASPTRLAEVML